MGTVLGTQPHQRGMASRLIIGTLVVGAAGGGAVLWIIGAIPVDAAGAYLRGQPLTVLIGVPAALVLLAVAIPGGAWEWRRVVRIRLARRREQRINDLTPLAELLGLTPQTLGEATAQALLGLDPGDFEKAMRELLTAHGYRDVEVVGQAGDHGIDLIGRTPDGRREFVAQCKRFQDAPIREREVRDFLGATYNFNVQHGAQLGLFLATSDYTEPARTFAATHDVDPTKRFQVRLRLFNGKDLVTMVRELAVR